MKANIITLLLILLGAVLLATRYGELPWTPMRIAGAAIAGPSLALLVLARIQLGRSFAVRAKAQSLVTHGLYSRIRNPIYVFGGLTIVGVFLYVNRPRALWILAVVVPLQIYRAHEEAKVLEAEFGEKYRQYKARTWF